MTLKCACKIALVCGITTTKEAVLNAKIHAFSRYDFDKIAAEMRGLEKDYKEVGDMLIFDIFPDLKKGR